jgi:hypothetical protein
MKSILLPFTAIALVAAFAPGCGSCSDSNIVTPGQNTDSATPAFDHDWGSWLSAAVNPDGQPAVAYYDRTQGALGYAVGTIADDGTVTWTHEEVDGYPDDQGLDSGDRGQYASMAIATDGTVWISYYDKTNKALRYARRNTDGSWDTGLADTGGGAQPNAGEWTSLALDASGNPVVAHYDAGMGQLRVAHWDGSSFSGEVVDEGTDYTPADTGATVSANVGQYARLRISDGVEYIAYYDAAAGDLKLAHGTSGAYTVETVASDGDVGQWPDMLIDGGTVEIAYQDVGNQDLDYAVGTPGSWNVSVVDDGDHVGADTALFMNGTYPAIVYFDGHDNNMKLARFDGQSWADDTVAGTDTALGFHNEVVTANGHHYAICYDYTDRGIL